MHTPLFSHHYRMPGTSSLFVLICR